ncbi:MAG: hypothetical protein GY938_16830 [Ketobacter sp.]|nr:hypothetical protein [Ketobacter sp.]
MWEFTDKVITEYAQRVNEYSLPVDRALLILLQGYIDKMPYVDNELNFRKAFRQQRVINDTIDMAIYSLCFSTLFQQVIGEIEEEYKKENERP